MFAWIKLLLTTSRQQRKEALGAAIRQFESAGGRDVHPGISSVLRADNFGFVVRVYHGYTKPPGRAWFRVSREMTEIQELSFEDVRQYGEQRLTM